jgi:hypothetical protein
MTTPSEPLYREIPLTQGQVTRVSVHRFEELNSFKWYAQWNSTTKSFYAVRNTSRVNGKSYILSMQRQILGLSREDPRQGDHENHDTLDNMDGNLRIATRTQNRHNFRINKNNTSGFRGVYPRGRRWTSRIFVSGRQLYLGERDTPQEASELYCQAARLYRGEFAKVD